MMFFNATLIYAFELLFANNDKQIQISKLKGIKNYYSLSIYVQATLESKISYDIVVGTQETFARSGIDVSAQIKKAYQDYI